MTLREIKKLFFLFLFLICSKSNASECPQGDNDPYFNVINNPLSINIDEECSIRISNPGSVILTANGSNSISWGDAVIFSNNSQGTTINNSGLIHNTGIPGDSNQDGAGIMLTQGSNTIINTGIIQSFDIDIFNQSSTTALTLINRQGGNDALTLAGQRPTNYSIIVNSNADYGKIIFKDWIHNYGSINNPTVTGNMTFGIYAGGIDGVAASSVTKGTYTSVLTGINANNIVSTTGTYSGFMWTLALQDESSAIWDLIISGASTADTQSSLATQARRLRSAFNSSVASSNFSNMNTYDCNLFDKNNMCMSAGGRYTSIDNPSSNNSAAVVVLGYKVSSNIRIGGFLDQSVNNNTPSGINISNKNPMMGAFAVWNQNADGLGYQIKIANAYQDKDVTTTRDVIGTSEAGTGKTNLNTQSYVGELSYAFNYQDSTIVRPFFAVRYTNIKQDAYTEDLTASVTAPLTYAKIGDRSTTALMGVKLNHALTPRTNLTASLGIEQDIHHKTDQITASGIADLTSENFNNNIKRTRPVASAGAYYAVTKTQRLSGDVYYQQLPFQSTGSATAYVNYIIGF